MSNNEDKIKCFIMTENFMFNKGGNVRSQGYDVNNEVLKLILEFELDSIGPWSF